MFYKFKSSLKTRDWTPWENMHKCDGLPKRQTRKNQRISLLKFGSCPANVCTRFSVLGAHKSNEGWQ